MIEVKNPDHISKGVATVIVNGAVIEGNVVPVLGSGEHMVEVVMGAGVKNDAEELCETGASL